MNTINKPDKTTYFIAWSDDSSFVHGIVMPNQNMSTGYEHLYKTVYKGVWSKKLLADFNFDIDKENEDIHI